jgi:hypothetical protein
MLSAITLTPLVVIVIITAIAGGAVIGYFLLRRRLGRSGRVDKGELFRFDSVTKLQDFCRERYQTNKVRCSSTTGEFLLHVERPSGESFESLIVHFEGEGTYAARLPEP